jgi:tetratricopeptide (TPR) repeat protein
MRPFRPFVSSASVPLGLVLVFIFLGPNPQLGAQKPNRAKADELIGDAGKKLAMGDFNANVQILKDAANVDPTNPRVWWKLCEGYQLTEELDPAIAACKRNIDINPDGISYNSLGLVYLAKKDYPNAVGALAKAVKDSQIPQVHNNFVWALLRAQQYEKAIPEVQRLIELSADNRSELTSALEALGATYIKLGQMDKAKEAFARVHKVEPGLNINTCDLRPDNKGDLNLDCTFSK